MNHLEDCLKPCIESIKAYCDLSDKEVIIAANGCTDGTKQYVESLGEPFKLLWWDKPMGFAVPNNEAAKIAKGEYILFLNNDAGFLPQKRDESIKQMLSVLDQPSIGIVGKQLRHNMETDRNFVIFYCAIMKKELFEKFGMFDEIFADGTCEDVDLCIKLSNAGHKLAEIPNLSVFHKGGTTIVQMPNMMERLNRNALILGKKWNSKWYQDQMAKQNHGIKVSIIIGTLNHLEDCLKPCCEAIQKYCNLEDKEVIIVANGCTDGTREYVQSLGPPFKLLWSDEALGYSRANNEGIKIARGEYVLLLNSDAFFLEQTKDTAINMLLEPFEKNPKVGITGPTLSVSPSIQREFIIFYCAMIKKDVFARIGLLDDVFGKGAGEDTDFCIKAVAAGYELAVAGRMDSRGPEGIIGSVPIWHRGEATVHDFADWDDHFDSNTKILMARYPITNEVKKTEVVNGKSVLCAIPTKGRYFTTLPLTIASVLSQTVKPDKLIIYDDGEHKDLREVPIYQYFFKNLDAAGIKWEVAFTPGIGQHHAHQRSNTSDDYKFVWRLDDDTIANPDVLEKLLFHMKDGVGAVAGSVVTPGGEAYALEYGIKLLDVNRLPNLQWARGVGIYEVEHLYSSFLYRTNIVDYCMELSKVAHREETIFTHRMFRAGYKLLVDRSATTWHYRNPEGGIRTESDKALWEHDEELFRKELTKWGYKFIALSHGLGDHLMFVNIIPELLKRCEKLVLFCVYGEAFQGIDNVIVRPMQEAGSFGVKETGVYEWMTKYNWKRSMLKAYEELYLN